MESMKRWIEGGKCGSMGEWKRGHAVDMIALPYKNLIESPTSLFLQLSPNTIMPAFSFTTVVNPNIVYLKCAFETL
jgi:hypothetical protein